MVMTNLNFVSTCIAVTNMNISRKLAIIITLAVFQVGITLWSMFEISKGATFHQLNFLHLKYSAVFSKQVLDIENGLAVDTYLLEASINNVKRQPIECLQQVNALNRYIMRQISTIYAIELCEKDIKDADRILANIEKYAQGNINQKSLLNALKIGAHAFNENSVLFEKPITKTVSFVMKTMTPLVVFISLLNVILIIYMSKNITSSISNVIRLLTGKNNREDLDIIINKNVPGELKALLDAAKTRLTSEFLMNEVNQKLESLVEQRTLSLTRANDELAQFAYRSSHDLKAPLTSTKRLAQFIVQDIENNQLDIAIGDAKKIIGQMTQLEELVIGILSLTEAEFIDEEQQEVDFDLLLTELRTTVSELLLLNNCTLEEKVLMSSCMLTEKIRLLQILENLVANAIKYCDPKKARCFVRVEIIEQLDTYVMTVEDNGLGIPSSRKGEVFQMFKRFHPKVSAGSGLGLAIVKKHIDFMHATISMSTSPAGTIFTMVFKKENTL